MRSDVDVLTELLKTDIVEVKFMKTDGTIRTMPCTLVESLIPPKEMVSSKSERKKNDDVVAVFALDKNEWRSFRKDSLIDFERITW